MTSYIIIGNFYLKATSDRKEWIVVIKKIYRQCIHWEFRCNKEFRFNHSCNILLVFSTQTSLLRHLNIDYKRTVRLACLLLHPLVLLEFLKQLLKYLLYLTYSSFSFFLIIWNIVIIAVSFSLSTYSLIRIISGSLSTD